MAKLVYTNVRLFTGGVDLTTNNNKVNMAAEYADQDVTNFASGGWKEVMAGLASSTIDAEGQWEAFDLTKVDDSTWAQLGGLTGWTVAPQGAAVASLAYFTNALTGSYSLLGDVGAVAPWKAKGVGSWPLVRGQIAADPGTARTVTGTGAGANLGAVAAGKQIYAALHVLSATGTTPSLTLTIESDTSNAFAGPTTRLTFAAATAIGGQILRAPGAITDTWWRPKWTISGTTPSFLIAAAFGIA